jgi:putative Mn2+ efflux pump MntP
MDSIILLLIALGLAMDCFAVSITSGISMKNLKLSSALKIAVFFGFFQATMPVLGWVAGMGLSNFIKGIDHWISFGLLCFVGVKMIYEAFSEQGNRQEDLNTAVLLVLSLATSIDALAVGLSFAFLEVSIFLPVLIIGFVTFAVSLSGVFIGNKLGHFFEKKMEIAGGLILIGIGIKILLGHLR